MVEDCGVNAPVLGLVGGIGAGKSAVAGFLAEAGCALSDSEKAAGEVLQREEIRKTLREWWGEDVFQADGSIDRAALGKIVFKDSDARSRLEGLMHPLIEEARQADFARADSPRAYVIDAPLLLEAGLDAKCDAVILVDAPHQMRLERVRSRGWDPEELNLREQAQWPLDRKRDRADHVLSNDGSLATLRTRTLDLLERLAPRSCGGRD